MLSCKDISQLASENFDKTLSPMQRMQFRMHLLMCHNCRLFVSQMALTIETIATITPLQPNDPQIHEQATKLMAISKTMINKE